MIFRSFKSAVIFLKLLEKRDRIKFYLIIGSNFLSSLLELIFIAFLGPLIYSFTGEENKLSFLDDFFFFISQFLGLENNLSFKLYFIFSFLLVKNLFSFFNIYILNKFSFSLENRLSLRIIESSLYQTKIEYSESKSSDLIKNATTDAHRINLFYTIPLITIITDLILIILLVSFQIYFDPIASLIIFISNGIVVLIFNLFSNKLVYRYGKELVKYEAKKIELIQQIFENLLVIKVSRLFDFFEKKFEKYNFNYLKNGFKQSVVQNSPKLFYETLIFLTIILLISLPKENSQIAFIGIFMATLYRILPSISRLSSSLQSLVFCEPSLNEVDNAIRKFSKDKNPNPSFRSLEFKNASFYYKKRKGYILKDFSFEIPKNKFIGIIGESGSGKTTLINLIMKLIQPTEGEILLNGKDYSNFDLKIGYVPQSIYLMNKSIIENIAFGINKENINLDRINKVIDLADLKKVVQKMDYNLNSLIGERGAKLSGGQIQRIAIARALYNDPDLLIFDESTNSLDINTKTKILRTIKNISKSKCVIYVTHDNDYLDIFNIIINLNNGSSNYNL